MKKCRKSGKSPIMKTDTEKKSMKAMKANDAAKLPMKAMKATQAKAKKVRSPRGSKYVVLRGKRYREEDDMAYTSEEEEASAK